MKHNLAKVLGMEEYNEEPNIRVEPTEDEVIQIEQDKFVQEMADHSEATAEALEAIGNAHELAQVISRNDSTDKTTYELLKVAVEQLKEKTGVKTQSVSLESLDKTSYKTEALQDIKAFVEKIWEAIKKAFFAMVEKVKAFFKGLFDRNKSIEKEADEIAKDAAELEKEINKAPKTPEQAKNYSSDYFGVKKNYFEETKGGGVPALGYAPGTTNKTTVGGFKTSDKDVDYSNNEYDRLPGAKGNGADGQSNFFSSDINRYLGINSKSGVSAIDSAFRDFPREVSDMSNAIGKLLLSADMPELGKDRIVIPTDELRDRVVKNTKFSIGIFTGVINIKEGVVNAEFRINSVSKDYGIPVSTPSDVRKLYVPLIEKLTTDLQRQEKIINEAMNKHKEHIEDTEKRALDIPENVTNREEIIASLKSSLFKSRVFMQSCITAQAAVSSFVQRTCKKILTYMRQSIDNIKRRMAHLMKRDGYIRDIKELEDAGWVNG